MERIPNKIEEEHCLSANSVKSYSYTEDPNPRFRPSMEDGHKIIDSFMGDISQGYFALFDGHGGKESMLFCKDNLHISLQNSIAEDPSDISKAFRKSFEQVDRQLQQYVSGTTATIGLIRRESGQKMLYIANVGDSKAYLIQRGITEITTTHNGNDPDEINRIVSTGGILIRGRVGGLLAVSRALGDHHLKAKGVISEPSVRQIPVSDGDLVLIASDGIWDWINIENLNNIARESAQNITEHLLKTAMSNGSQDNASILAIIV